MPHDSNPLSQAPTSAPVPSTQSASPNADLANPRIVGRVSLRRDRDDKLLHRFIECWIFFRWQSFKNRPRGNFLILRAFLVVVAFVVLSALAVAAGSRLLDISLAEWTDYKDALKPEELARIAIGFFVTVAGVYWHMSRLYNRQWQHCNNVYTEFLKHADRPTVRPLLANALAHDLLVCDMWAHRSHCQHFADELTKAIKTVHRDDPSTAAVKVNEANLGRFAENDVDSYLSKYETILLENSTLLVQPSATSTNGNANGKSASTSSATRELDDDDHESRGHAFD